MKRAKAAGFGLIEFLVAVLIIGILVTIVPPALDRFFSAGRLEGALQEVAAALNHARTKALSQGKPVKVAILSGPQWCVAAGTACECGASCDCAGCDVSLVKGRDHDKVTLTATAQQYTLDSVNGIASHTGIIEMTSGERQERISVNKLGKAWICRGSEKSC